VQLVFAYASTFELARGQVDLRPVTQVEMRPQYTVTKGRASCKPLTNYDDWLVIWGSKRNYILRCDNESEMEEWHQALLLACNLSPFSGIEIEQKKEETVKPGVENFLSTRPLRPLRARIADESIRTRNQNAAAARGNEERHLSALLGKLTFSNFDLVVQQGLEGLESPGVETTHRRAAALLCAKASLETASLVVLYAKLASRLIFHFHSAHVPSFRSLLLAQLKVVLADNLEACASRRHALEPSREASKRLESTCIFLAELAREQCVEPLVVFRTLQSLEAAGNVACWQSILAILSTAGLWLERQLESAPNTSTLAATKMVMPNPLAKIITEYGTAPGYFSFLL
jgi:hypothetical protein